MIGMERQWQEFQGVEAKDGMERSLKLEPRNK